VAARRPERWGTPGWSASEVGQGEKDLATRRRRQLPVWLLGAVAGLLVAAGVGSGRDRFLAGAAAAACLLAAWLRRPRRDPERWLRGAAGEEATAALLDRLSSRRWVVLHDRRLPGTSANVDHVVIGRRGVWVIDSKAYRAPLRAGWRSVRVGDHKVDTGPVAWEASIVADRLDVEVHPLVAVHGRGLARRGRRCDGVRVLPADALVAHLRRARRRPRLERAEVARLTELALQVLPEA
jgi:hypothetical protein